MLRLAFIVMLLAGCASSPHGVNTSKEVIKSGVIESITPITMDNSSGGTAGSIAGQVGGMYSGSMVGVILGSVAGGTAASQAGIATKAGVELWIKLDADNASIYVMQALGNDHFNVGDHVRVIRKQGETRVEADNGK